MRGGFVGGALFDWIACGWLSSGQPGRPPQYAHTGFLGNHRPDGPPVNDALPIKQHHRGRVDHR